MALKQISSVMFFVRSIKESRDWYREFLDSDPVEDLPDFVSFQVGASLLNFHLSDNKSPVSTGGHVAYWYSDSFDLDIKRALQLGGSLWRGPLEFEPGKRICQLRDPFGNVFGLESWSP